MNKKIFNFINLAIFLLVISGDVWFILTESILAKSLTSSLFVIMAGINLFYAIKTKSANIKFCIAMIAGLFFAMLGDILLEVDFITGAVLFAVGHIGFFISYCFLIKFSWFDIIAGSIIFIPSVLFITLAPIFEFDPSILKVLCALYAVVISCMLGKAIVNFIRTRNLLNLLLVLGSFLFFFSDLMLLLDNFAALPAVFGVLCLATYYPAECLLAYSILQSANDEK